MATDSLIGSNESVVFRGKRAGRMVKSAPTECIIYLTMQTPVMLPDSAKYKYTILWHESATLSDGSQIGPGDALLWDKNNPDDEWFDLENVVYWGSDMGVCQAGFNLPSTLI